MLQLGDPCTSPWAPSVPAVISEITLECALGKMAGTEDIGDPKLPVVPTYDIEFRNVRFTVPSERSRRAPQVILKSVSGSCRQCRLTAIMGASGAGKTFSAICSSMQVLPRCTQHTRKRWRAFCFSFYQPFSNSFCGFAGKTTLVSSATIHLTSFYQC